MAILRETERDTNIRKWAGMMGTKVLSYAFEYHAHDRLIGGLWANLSEGRCRFVMIKDKRWDRVEEHLK